VVNPDAFNSAIRGLGDVFYLLSEAVKNQQGVQFP
jgi:hypothetical protein